MFFIIFNRLINLLLFLFSFGFKSGLWFIILLIDFGLDHLSLVYVILFNFLEEFLLFLKFCKEFVFLLLRLGLEIAGHGLKAIQIMPFQGVYFHRIRLWCSIYRHFQWDVSCLIHDQVMGFQCWHGLAVVESSSGTDPWGVQVGSAHHAQVL